MSHSPLRRQQRPAGTEKVRKVGYGVARDGESRAAGRSLRREGPDHRHRAAAGGLVKHFGVSGPFLGRHEEVKYRPVVPNGVATLGPPNEQAGRDPVHLVGGCAKPCPRCSQCDRGDVKHSQIGPAVRPQDVDECRRRRQRQEGCRSGRPHPARALSGIESADPDTSCGWRGPVRTPRPNDLQGPPPLLNYAAPARPGNRQPDRWRAQPEVTQRGRSQTRAEALVADDDDAHSRVPDFWNVVRAGRWIRHSSTLRSMINAPGNSPSRCRCSTGRVSTTSAPAAISFSRLADWTRSRQRLVWSRRTSIRALAATCPT